MGGLYRRVEQINDEDWIKNTQMSGIHLERSFETQPMDQLREGKTMSTMDPMKFSSSHFISALLLYFAFSSD